MTKTSKIICTEFSTANNYVRPNNFVISNDGGKVLKLSPDDDKGNEKSLKNESFKQYLAEVFLPYGYPDSVSDDYLAYQLWDTCQAFCSSLVGTLATHAVLTGYQLTCH